MILEKRIDNFVGYFQSELAKVAAIESPHYKRTLLVILLDTLGRTRFPKGTIYKRITGIVSEFSGYLYLSNVCLAQLCIALENKGFIDTQLYQHSHRELLRWRDGLVCHAKSEPELASLLQHAEQKEVKLVTENTFLELLFVYRNVLVHEFRVPGYGMDFDDTETDPYTHSYSGRPRQLVFPSGFLIHLCENCLQGLTAYLRSNRLDPYDSFEFGSQWREARP